MKNHLTNMNANIHKTHVLMLTTPTTTICSNAGTETAIAGARAQVCVLSSTCGNMSAAPALEKTSQSNLVLIRTPNKGAQSNPFCTVSFLLGVLVEYSFELCGNNGTHHAWNGAQRRALWFCPVLVAYVIRRQANSALVLQVASLLQGFAKFPRQQAAINAWPAQHRCIIAANDVQRRVRIRPCGCLHCAATTLGYEKRLT
jgi:hypothetical protein